MDITRPFGGVEVAVVIEFCLGMGLAAAYDSYELAFGVNLLVRFMACVRCFTLHGAVYIGHGNSYYRGFIWLGVEGGIDFALVRCFSPGLRRLCRCSLLARLEGSLLREGTLVPLKC